jgi:hypothetical protein
MTKISVNTGMKMFFMLMVMLPLAVLTVYGYMNQILYGVAMTAIGLIAGYLLARWVKSDANHRFWEK